MKSLGSGFTLGVTLTLMAGISCAHQLHRVDQESGIRTWELISHGVSLSLTQILPEQARAFYVNRGFELDDIEDYVDSCVYMAVLRNDQAPGVMQFRLANWTVRSDTIERPPLDADHWLSRTGLGTAPAPARLAFRWAQLPAAQEYQPGGDWNQGMLSMGLPPGARFDLVFRWNVGNKTYSDVMRNVHCAQ